MKDKEEYGNGIGGIQEGGGHLWPSWPSPASALYTALCTSVWFCLPSSVPSVFLSFTDSTFLLIPTPQENVKGTASQLAPGQAGKAEIYY